MAESPAYYFQQAIEDVCPDCGNYGRIIATCDFNTGRVINEKCESCFEQWYEGWAKGEA